MFNLLTDLGPFVKKTRPSLTHTLKRGTFRLYLWPGKNLHSEAVPEWRAEEVRFQKGVYRGAEVLFADHIVQYYDDGVPIGDPLRVNRVVVEDPAVAEALSPNQALGAYTHWEFVAPEPLVYEELIWELVG